MKCVICDVDMFEDAPDMEGESVVVDGVGACARHFDVPAEDVLSVLDETFADGHAGPDAAQVLAAAGIAPGDIARMPADLSYLHDRHELAHAAFVLALRDGRLAAVTGEWDPWTGRWTPQDVAVSYHDDVLTAVEALDHHRVAGEKCILLAKAVVAASGGEGALA